MLHVTKPFQHLKIQLEAIISATNNFADENCIGKGGFGKVYKGELVYSMGQAVVAIKRLDRAFGQGDPEFWKEIIMLSRYKHENIVSLLGFCDENGEKILVYEYASKKSLDLYLKSDDLTWIRRLKICIGAARGLAYLHNPGRTQQRVLHRDIKSSNILLDENWNARISDMGLSKFGPANQQITFLVSNAVGTIGYCDPVYVETGVLTKESDVYSFGVVLFEVLCGRLSIVVNDDKHQRLAGLARECYEQNKLNEIIHGNIKDEINSNSLKEFTRIAYQCLKRDLEERPLMSHVVRILQRALEHQGDAISPSNYGSKDEYIAGPSTQARTVVEEFYSMIFSHNDPVRWRKVFPDLYPLVEELEPEAAPQIMGSFMDQGPSDIRRLMESPEELKAMVAKAMEVLRNRSPQQQEAKTTTVTKKKKRKRKKGKRDASGYEPDEGSSLA